MSYLDDVDLVREYVRTEGRVDFRRMQEVGPDLLRVEFLDNVEHHAASIAGRVATTEHVEIVRGETRSDHAARAARYWADKQEEVVSLMAQNRQVTSVSFGSDDTGPLLHVGIYPFTDATAQDTRAIFAPYRVELHDQEPPVALEVD